MACAFFNKMVNAEFFEHAKRLVKYLTGQLNIIELDLINQIPLRHKIPLAVSEIFQIYLPEYQKQMILQSRKCYHISPLQAYSIRIFFTGYEHTYPRLLLHDHIKTNHP